MSSSISLSAASTRLSTVTTKAITTSAPLSTSVLSGCEDTYITSILETYCTNEAASPPSCTAIEAASCTSEYNFASSLYQCIASHAPKCTTISDYISGFSTGLQECTSLAASGISGSASAANTNATSGVSKGATPAQTTATPTATGTESLAAQSSAAATTSAKSGGSKAEVRLGTMGVLGLAGGVAMWFLGGGF